MNDDFIQRIRGEITTEEYVRRLKDRVRQRRIDNHSIRIVSRPMREVAPGIWKPMIDRLQAEVDEDRARNLTPKERELAKRFDQFMDDAFYDTFGPPEANP